MVGQVLPIPSEPGRASWICSVYMIFIQSPDRETDGWTKEVVI